MLAKVIVLQIYWYVVVYFGLKVSPLLFPLLSSLLVYLNYVIFKPNIDPIKYIMITIIFFLWGLIQDGLLVYGEIIEVNFFPFWMTSLWIVFACYFDDLFHKMKRINTYLLGLIGGVGGTLSYYGGAQLSGLVIQDGMLLKYCSLVFVSWFLFFPFTFYLVYKKSFLDWILDRSIYFSFDRSGFKRHSKFFINEKRRNLAGENILVTGGTSGIGLQVTKDLISLGAKVYITGRNKNRGLKAESIGAHFISLDLSDWDAVKLFCSVNEICFDHIVLNAGGMPTEIQYNQYKVEHQVSSQLVGHYYLSYLLKKKSLLSKGAKIVWVSSGGMYLKKISIEDLYENKKYDKVETYANVKRAQVTLVEELAKDSFWNENTIVSMHPGWVATDGLENALPKFYNYVKKRLRTTNQGADTISWLISSNEQIKTGELYFDRNIVSPYLNKSYNPDKQKRLALLKYVNGFEKQF